MLSRVCVRAYFSTSLPVSHLSSRDLFQQRLRKITILWFPHATRPRQPHPVWLWSSKSGVRNLFQTWDDLAGRKVIKEDILLKHHGSILQMLLH
jgi:hypothetical protein